MHTFALADSLFDLLLSSGSACSTVHPQELCNERHMRQHSCMLVYVKGACLVRATGLLGFAAGEREEDGALRGELRSLSLPESCLFLLLPLSHILFIYRPAS